MVIHVINRGHQSEDLRGFNGVLHFRVGLGYFIINYKQLDEKKIIAQLVNGENP